ncbi:MAG: hypothetical protein JNM56_28725 [Planctomycetia bacterium]|nr:hypothetical protein [Planctomycetia bacterium]
MDATAYLVFGDLHGRILPAFRLAAVWARESGVRVAALLQVGDLGWFPEPGKLDKATQRHAEKDSLELGAQLLAQPCKLADDIFADEHVAGGLWFTAGNHEDYDSLEFWEQGAGAQADSFCVDAYCRVHCIRDGRAAELPGGLRVGALWGIDDAAPNARRKTLPRARIRARSATQLAGADFDVLLMHESPRDAVYTDAGSSDISALIGLAQPAFAYFGHYHTEQRQIEGPFGDTQVYHLAGMEMRGRDGFAEPGSVGVLTWHSDGGEFAYLEESWLRTFTRHNWRYR